MIGKRPNKTIEYMLDEFLKEESYAELKRKTENGRMEHMEVKNLPNGRTLCQ